MRALVLVLALPSIALAELQPDLDEGPAEPPALSQVSVPCLRDERDRRVVVAWWIEDSRTGERRAVGSQEVRLRC